jgi:hypothetical protein
MARGGLDWEGIAAVYVTFKAATALASVVTASGVAAVEGKAVTITGNGEVGFGSDGNKLLGLVDKYESDGYLTVQTGGYATFPGVSGSLPTAGDFVVVNGSGAVKASTGAVGPAKAISVDNTANVNTVVVLIA